MTSKKAGDTAQSESAQAGHSEGFVEHAFHVGMSAAEDIHQRAFKVPLDMLEGMGAPHDKMEMLRDKSQQLISELYSAINSVAAQIGPMSPPTRSKPPAADKDD